MKNAHKRKQSKTLNKKANTTKIANFISKVKSKDRKFVAYAAVVSTIFALVICVFAYTTYNNLNKNTAEQNTPSGSFELKGTNNPETVAILNDSSASAGSGGQANQSSTSTTNKPNNSNNTASSSNDSTITPNNEGGTTAASPTQQTQTVTCRYIYGPMDGIPCPNLPPNNYYNTSKGCYATGYGTYIQCPDYKTTVYSIEASRVCNDSSYCKTYCTYYHASNNVNSIRTIEMPSDTLPNCSV